VQKNFAEREKERIIIRGFDNISRGGNNFFVFNISCLSHIAHSLMCAGLCWSLFTTFFFLFVGLYVCDKR
jgi:hypothetical protein